MAVTLDSSVSYETILVKFGNHPDKDFVWFSTTINAWYDEKNMNAHGYSTMFTSNDPNNFEFKKELLNVFDDWVHKRIRNITGIVHKDDNDTALVARLKDSKTKYLLKNDIMAQIEDADDFANAYKSFEKDPSVAMKQMLNDLGYLVIWKAAPLHVVPGFIAETSIGFVKRLGETYYQRFFLNR